MRITLIEIRKLVNCLAFQESIMVPIRGVLKVVRDPMVVSEGDNEVMNKQYHGTLCAF